jgi:hypothetical protein
VSLFKTCVLSRIVVKQVQTCLEVSCLPLQVQALDRKFIINLSNNFQGRKRYELISHATLLDPHFKKQRFSDGRFTVFET